MVDPISVPQAAKALDLSPARVRAMAASGQLEASKLGDRWFVERAAVERRRKNGAHHGRRFSPKNAWALLALASGDELEQVDPSLRSRLRRAVGLEGVEGLGPRLAHRAEAFQYQAHPGEISHLLEDPDIVRSGISAAGDLGLIAGREADGYLPASKLRAFSRRHALEPSGADGNVRLRVVPDEAWRFLQGLKVAPRAAVALDLAEEADPRSARAGQVALRELDDRHRASQRHRNRS